MKLVATRGDGIFLIAENGATTGKAKGFIYNVFGDASSPVQYLLAFVKFGYWDEVKLDDLPGDVRKRLKNRFPGIG